MNIMIRIVHEFQGKKKYDDYSLLMSEAKFKAKEITQAVKVLKY